LCENLLEFLVSSGAQLARYVLQTEFPKTIAEKEMNTNFTANRVVPQVLPLNYWHQETHTMHRKVPGSITERHNLCVGNYGHLYTAFLNTFLSLLRFLKTFCEKINYKILIRGFHIAPGI
jgi:hypothetical protein